jgi:CTP synthase (UTP-ammonia lyase)
LRGTEQTVIITPGTQAFAAYGKDRSTEKFMCSYGVNEHLREELFSAGLTVAGVDAEGNARIAERSDHPFFLATLFMPQLSSEPGLPHPLVMAFLEAASAHSHTRR